MRSPDIKLSARSWSVCPPTSILLVSASVAPHAKSLQCHELTERALHEERGNAFYPRLAIAASPPADGKHPRKNWPRRTSFSRIYRSRKPSLGMWDAAALAAAVKDIARRHRSTRRRLSACRKWGHAMRSRLEVSYLEKPSGSSRGSPE